MDSSACPHCGFEFRQSMASAPDRCANCGQGIPIHPPTDVAEAANGIGVTVGTADRSEDNELVSKLRSAFEYQADALAASGTCWLGEGGGMNETIGAVYAEAALPEGTRLGDFEILSELGRGGMGIVYRAKQHSLGRLVALKVLPGFARFGRSAVERFQTETRAAAQLHHTNVVGTHAQGEYNGQYYYAMELIDGISLDVAIRSGCDWVRQPRVRDAEADRQDEGADPQNTPVDERADLTRRTTSDYRAIARAISEIADALAFAHKSGVVHRDVKPHNLLLDAGGRIYLTDFGLARLTDSDLDLTRPGEVMGTPAYLSPEQTRGDIDRIDGRTDVYSLGVTLYELLTGRRPYEGQLREQIMRDVCDKEPTSPRRLIRQIPAELETICLVAMAKRPERRYATAAAMADDLGRFADGRRIRAKLPGRLHRWVRKAGRHKAIAFAISATTVAVMATAGWAFFAHASRINEAESLARQAYEQLAFYDYRRPDLVQPMLARAIHLGADAPETAWAQALVAIGQTDDAKAIALLEDRVSVSPEDRRAWYLLAWSQWRGGAAVAAQRTFARVEQMGEPQAADTWFFRGLAKHYDDPVAAIEAYRNAQAFRAQEQAFYPQAVLHLARARNQQLYATRSLAPFPEAADSLRQLVSHESYGAFPYYLLSITHRLAAEVYRGSQGTRDGSLVQQNFTDSLKWAREGQRLEPANDRPVTAEAECLESMGDYAAAVDARTRALALASHDRAKWESYHYRWRLHYWLGDHSAALEDLRVCQGLDPASRAYGSLYPALVSAQQGELDAARTRFRSLAQDPDADVQDLILAASGLRILGAAEEAEGLLAGADETPDLAAGLVPPQTSEWVEALLGFCRGQREFAELETLAAQASSPWRLWGEAHFHAAAIALACGDRDKAYQGFRAAERSFDSEMRYAYHGKLIRVQMDTNADWPPWIPPQQATESGGRVKEPATTGRK